MFSFEYYNKEMIISTYNEKRINFLNIEKLRRIVITALKKPCHRVVINLVGVHFIDPESIDKLKLLASMAANVGTKMMFLNANSEVCKQFKENHFDEYFEFIFPNEQLII